MKKIISTFSQSFTILLGDKYILLFSLLPIIIGILLYMLIGSLAFFEALDSSKEWISSIFSSNSWFVEAIVWIVGGIVLLALYFVANFTFILIVSLISCLFSDLISSRVEQQLIESKVESISLTVKKTVMKFWRILTSEIKKIIFIAILATISTVCSFTAVLVPVSILISWILVVIQFLDYSWCRHEMSFSECLDDLKRNFFFYIPPAIIFSLLFLVPFVGLLVFPFAIIYFTTLFVKNQIGDSDIG